MSTVPESTRVQPVPGRPPAMASDADPNALPSPIVFVGGTGRSGTHALAHLLGRHSQYANVRVESRFHVSRHGFPALLAGEVGPERFVLSLRRLWWRRVAAGQPMSRAVPIVPFGRSVRGLHKIAGRRRLTKAVERFERRWTHHPESACRRLFLDLLWQVPRQAGKPGLVEMSTFTVAEAPTLLRLFPEARLIHIVRDGRDSGSSKVSKRQEPDHPRNVGEGLEWWLERLRITERGVAAVPEDRVLTLSLDDLAVGERERTYRTLLDFLGLEDEPKMRDFFERRITAQNASRGRWRRDLSEAEQREVIERYEVALDEIERLGFRSAPLLRDVYRRLG